VLRNLLAIKSQTDNIDEIHKIKNQINFIHGLLLTKNMIKNVVKTKDELVGFIEMNEPILLGFHRKRGYDPIYNDYIKRIYDLKYINELNVIQIRSIVKHIKIKYFDYCDKNNIKIYYCNTDSFFDKII
jgi:hypothetical protein